MSSQTHVEMAEKDGVEAFRRRDKVTQRKVNTPRLVKYWKDMWNVTQTLIGMQVDEQALKGRLIAYKDVDPNDEKSLAYIRRLIIDLALSIKVHPIALGLKGQTTGEILVPAYAVVEVILVNGIFEFNKRDRVRKPDFSKWGVKRNLSPSLTRWE